MSPEQKNLPAAYAAIDKAMKRGVIKKNTAARKKSSLSPPRLRGRSSVLGRNRTGTVLRRGSIVSIQLRGQSEIITNNTIIGAPGQNRTAHAPPQARVLSIERRGRWDKTGIQACLFWPNDPRMLRTGALLNVYQNLSHAATKSTNVCWCSPSSTRWRK